jgi:FKBP-type peptidyl-prolyl cis-trans isomerase 2
MPIETDKVSIRYTLTLEDGTLLSYNVDGTHLDYTRGQNQVIPALEEAMLGATPDESRRITLSHVSDSGLRLDAARLALLLGHPGETLILTAEIT